MYYITVKLTPKGKMVCSTETKTFNYNHNSEPTKEQIDELLKEEFLPELVESIISIKKSFEDIKIGDIVRIYTPTNKGDLNITLGEVVTKWNSGGTKEFQVHSLTDDMHYSKSIYRDILDIRFNFEGNEIGGSRKYKRYVELASCEEIQHYNEIKEIDNSYLQIKELISYHYNWEEDVTIPIFLSTDDIITIRDILVNAKNKYEKTQEFHDNVETLCDLF